MRKIKGSLFVTETISELLKYFFRVRIYALNIYNEYI